MIIQTIEKNLGETIYREFFYSCKTLLFYSKDGKTRRFVEYSKASDYGKRICPNIEELKVAVGNAVLRLIAEGNEEFFFNKSDAGVEGPIMVDQNIYWLKYEDVTEQWPNHYWARLKAPIVGFKAVSKDYGSVWLSRNNYSFENCPRSYLIGETYSVDERKMLEGSEKGFYFSPSLAKAMNYVKKDERLLLVAASGLIFVKNSWDDLAASALTIVKELSKEEIDLLNPTVHVPKAFWNGYRWESRSHSV